MKTVEVTKKEFQEMGGFNNYAEASNLLNVLQDKGMVKEVGQKRRADGKGKPSTIYEVPQEVTLTLFSDVKQIQAETEEA